MSNLPYFWELAENQIKYAGPRDKTINIKITINTARMMVGREKGLKLDYDVRGEELYEARKQRDAALMRWGE
uniref:Uncharacterized protein n=1 Tax=viral metagenome TaxID=1070528 RepID=A0A6M3J5L6_9ZZZZ